jgi:hypothetical protein
MRYPVFYHGTSHDKHNVKMAFMPFFCVYAGFRITDFGLRPNPVRNDGFFTLFLSF